MSKEFSVIFRDTADADDIRVDGSFPDECWSRLSRFAEEAEVLQRSSVLQQELRVHVSLRKAGPGQPICCDVTLPSGDEIAVLLHRLRPFVLQNEFTNFDRSANILSMYIENLVIREVIQTQRDLFNGKDFQRQLRIDWKSPALESVVNADRTFLHWLNAYEYHRDRDKAAEIEEFRKLLPANFLRGIFISMLVDKIKAILNVAVIIRKLQRSDGIPLTCSFAPKSPGVELHLGN
jgi:hypothetical protein